MSVVPEAAQAWDVLDDGRRYLFHLRPGRSWSDGVPLTAADFAYAWRRVLDPATGSPNAHYLYDLKGAQAWNQGGPDAEGQVGVRALDDVTLEVELETSASYFLQLVANVPLAPVPRHIVTRHGRAWTQPDRIVSSGPFRLAACTPGGDLVLDADPSYHGRASGNVQRVVLSVSTGTEQLAAYEQGHLDLFLPQAVDLPLPEMDRVRQRHPAEYLSVPSPMTLYVGFDTARPPFDDRGVRRAFALALDRELIADVVGRGLNFPATGGLVPPGIPGHTPGIGLPHDPEAARRSLVEAGFARAQDFPKVECLARSSASLQPYLEYLQRAWRETLGVRVTWTLLPRGALLDRLFSDPPNLWLMGWIADYADPDNFLRVAEWRAASHWLDERYERLIEAVRRIVDQQRRLEMVRHADQVLVEEAPVVPLIYARTHILAKPWLRVPPPTYSRFLFKDFVLEPHQT